MMGISDGTNIRALKGNSNITLLASDARIISTSSPAQNAYNARGVRVKLVVSVASGTGGLQVIIRDSTGAGPRINETPTLVTATGTFVYEIYPGIGAAGGG